MLSNQKLKNDHFFTQFKLRSCSLYCIDWKVGCFSYDAQNDNDDNCYDDDDNETDHQPVSVNLSCEIF